MNYTFTKVNNVNNLLPQEAFLVKTERPIENDHECQTYDEPGTTHEETESVTSYNIQEQQTIAGGNGEGCLYDDKKAQEVNEWQDTYVDEQVHVHKHFLYVPK